MNMLFWVWYDRYIKEINEDESAITPGDDYIPSPIYLIIGAVGMLVVIAFCYAAVFL